MTVATEAKPRLAVRPGRCRPYNKRLNFARPSGRLLSPAQPTAGLGLYLDRNKKAIFLHTLKKAVWMSNHEF